MMMHAFSLTDDALAVELGRLAGCEREATSTFIVHLAEFDRRRLYEGAGYPSMFAYCRAALRLSEDAAGNRIRAARAVRWYPEIAGMLADGSLSLTAVRLLAPHLTSENHEELLAAASGCGKEEVEELLARFFPKPGVSASVRKLAEHRVPAAATAATSIVAAPESEPVADPPAAVSSAEQCFAPVTPKSRPPLVRPLAPERYEVRFTADAETRRLLREAQDLLGHALPTGDLAAVFHRALTVLVADLKRRKFGATSRPRSGQTPDAASRTPAAAVRREVVARDGSRCAYVSRDGRRCGATRLLEFHHVVPLARGGRATVDNIQLRCRAHNGYEVDLFFGPGKRWTKERTRKEVDPEVREWIRTPVVTCSGTGATPPGG